MSQAKADELSSSKPSRLAKSEGIQLHALLVDTPPELTIENGSMGMHALRQTFETYGDGGSRTLGYHEELLSSIHQPDDHQVGR